MKTWTKEVKRQYARDYRGPYYLAHKDKIKGQSTTFWKKNPAKHAGYCRNTIKNNPKKYNSAYFTQAYLKYYYKNHLAFLMYDQLKRLAK